MIQNTEIISNECVDKKVAFVCPMKDDQTGLYIRNAFVQKNCPVAPIDSKEEMLLGQDSFNQKLIDDVERLKPDFLLVAKGLGITSDTVKKLKDTTKVIYWMFDHTFSGQPITKNDTYMNAIKNVDTYYTVVRGDVDTLQKCGVNAKWLPEAASPQFNYPVPINYGQELKYGAEASFCGSIGTVGYHEDRLVWLDSVLRSGVLLKLYGDVYNKKLVPDRLMKNHFGKQVINDMHNIVVGASQINLGRSGWPDVDMAMSARTYRVLASEGFHLTNNTLGIDTMFKAGKHLDTYTSRLDCLKKIKYWLELPEERNKIAAAGMKEVLKKHTFKNRIEQILGDLK